MERVAYVLGSALDLPVPPGIHLEEFNGETGVISCQIPHSVTWSEFERLKLSHGGIDNLDQVPTFIAFDIWLANFDRAPRNILLQSSPPDLAPAKANKFSFCLIDHGHCGLWPVAKFGNDPNEPASFIDIGDGTTVDETLIRRAMPPAYWGCYENLSESRRDQILDSIKGVEDDLIDEAVFDVPDSYMTVRERELTAELLKNRRDNVDALSHALL